MKQGYRPKVGGYRRISEDDQDTRDGVRTQGEDVDALCAANDWDCIPYEDNDLSAYKRNVTRPDFERMLRDLKAGNLDGIAALDLDRLFRQPRDLERAIDIYEEAAAKGRKLIFACCTVTYDLTTSDGRFMARLYVSMANKSSADTSRRIKRHQLDRAKQGKAHAGPAPFGWNPEDKGKLWPKEAVPLRKAIEDFLAGKRLATMAREWAESGVVSRTSGKPFSDTNFGRLLVRPRNCGLRVYQGEPFRDETGAYVIGDWETVCTIEEWEAVCAVFEKRKDGGLLDRSSKYLLSGITRCGVCGHKMRGQKRNKGKSYGYVCVANQPGACGTIGVAGEQVDEMITELVMRASEALSKRAKVPALTWGKTGRLAEVEEEIAVLRKQWQGKELSTSTFVFAVEELEKERTVLRHERAVFHAEAEANVKASVNVRKDWPRLSLEQRRRVIMHNLSAVLIHPSSKGKRFNPDRVEPVFRA